jgi:hypothetical protein
LPVIPEVRELPVHTLPVIPEVRELPVHTSPVIPEVRELPVHTSPVIPGIPENLGARPRPGSRAVPRADPRCDSVKPPPCYLRIVPLRIGCKPDELAAPFIYQPYMPRGTVELADHSGRMFGGFFGRVLDTAPCVHHVTIKVVHHLDA